MNLVSKGNETRFRIGVDVGGTNTDAALLQGFIDKSSGRTVQDISVVATIKSPTTSDVSTGIYTAIRTLLENDQGDASKLERVAVIRLCGPFCRTPAPFVDFPRQLRSIMEGYTAYVSGGIEVDGRAIGNVDRDEIMSHAKAIDKQGITDIAVVGVFSALEMGVTQEQQVKKILQECLPDVQVVCSRDMGSGGFMERENASIMNASVLGMAAETISSFQSGVEKLGKTNSLTGAIFLSGIAGKLSLEECQVIMVDIGGTMTELAALSSTGHPRPSPVTVKVGGVRTAFQMPEVLSIGLGGGSIIRDEHSPILSVGPDSVGYKLRELSTCFGGSVLTATDIVVATGATLIQPKWDAPPTQSSKELDLDVVAGGSFLQMQKLKNVRQCLRVPHHDVANAVGAAMAKVSGDVDRIIKFDNMSYSEMLPDLEREARETAALNGAFQESIRIVQMDILPLPFIGPKAVRAIVKAVGELSWRQPVFTQTKPIIPKASKQSTREFRGQSVRDLGLIADPLLQPQLRHYVPRVLKDTGEWFVSVVDLAFMALGCSIVATGGGGTVRPTCLDCLQQLSRFPNGMRIIDPGTLNDNAVVVPLAYIGAPTVSDERLLGGNEIIDSTKMLQKHLAIEKIDAFISPEIGGSNGLTSLTVGARMAIPTVDADTLGRAYPRSDLALPYVYKKAVQWPAACVYARGNAQIIAKSESQARFEGMARSLSIELRLYNSITFAPFSGRITKDYCLARSLSLSWFIGREVYLARQEGRDPVAAALSIVPGGRMLFYGKVVRLERKEKDGWTVGSVVIEGLEDESQNEQTATRSVVLQFQNQYLYVAFLEKDGSLNPICTTPDLVSVLDLEDEPVGTHELRYGLRLSVIGMPAHKLWKTPEGMRAAEPKAFGLSMEYTSIEADWKEPESVIAKYGV